MQARFLLGPAGSGKTFRCLAEVRAALANNPDGKPLVLLAPKQATFQLERQLLADPAGAGLNGYTRLQILSFERLAQFVFEKLNVAPPELLSDEGRVMVLRALLMRHGNELNLFSKSARRPGFARQLSQLLNELQQHQFTPGKLRSLAQRENLRRDLRDKLLDLALLHEAYANWLDGHDLQDANHLLDFATGALRQKILNPQPSTLNFGGLWLDGFAEMTPQELDLLAAVLPFCEHATLAFCLDESGAGEKENSWLSVWSGIGKTFQQCRQRIEKLPDCKIEIKILPRDSGKGRFAKNPALRHLEQTWSGLNQNPESRIPDPENAVRIAACQNVEAEAVFAAREILKFVRAGNRFRDCAILVRSLDGHHKPLVREFRRYGIPFFLDRRESVSHHPLAELTRSALRTVAFDWENEDWFAALKAGFSPVEETEIDRLENAALESGWHGKKWREPLPDDWFERLRKKIQPPFEHFSGQLAKIKFQPDGKQLAGIIRELWDDLKVERILERWSSMDAENSALRTSHFALHRTVWEQMNSWLDNVALAFPREPLPLRDWLPILEAGLANLAVGVIPPVLDEVLIGAVDRARNPDLKLALVLGVNESVFPAVPPAPALLTNSDRDELEQQDAAFGMNLRDQLSRERYLGYIACTRSSEKLFLTFARQGPEGKVLNLSPFISHLQKIFPMLKMEEFSSDRDWREAEHANELVPMLAAFAERRTPERLVEVTNPKPAVPEAGVPELLELPVLKSLAENLGALREPDEKENLSPALAEKLYGPVLKSSVSRLEEFAQCPFRFFVHSGLRAGERKVFELDARERGSFQHEVLKLFHEQLVAEKKRWRDITPLDARERVGKIAAELAPDYRDGLLHADAQSKFTARVLAVALQDFVGTLVAWMRGQYQFDPARAELDFGFPDSGAPAWEIDLNGGHRLALRGRIDRIDLCRDGDRTLAVVMDYKSSQRKSDKILMEHGVQLQLPAYLAAVRSWPLKIMGVEKIVPAGFFYVNLRGQFESSGSRDEALAGADDARRFAYRHNGRFDASVLDKLDSAHSRDQFNYQLNKDGEVRSNSTEALPRAEFEKLLHGVEQQLRAMGGRIFTGAAQVDPYRKGKQTACDFCDYRAACRIDKWTHPWRVLRTVEAEEKT